MSRFAIDGKPVYMDTYRGWKLSTRMVSGRLAFIATRFGVSMNSCTGDDKLSGETLINMIDQKCKEERI